ncbi:MAG TPA: protein kinase [Thermoanaerobaculia bacterium]|nr:protein kinase [Thermoanaerobaculia bacterium]
MIGRTLSHYRVEERLGAGGMGEVFLARDLALGRPAALKIIAQPLSSELTARLRREAEACARLQHPAIATFYEAGEVDGVAFLAMEYVPGETLRDRLRRGPLPVPEALIAAGALLEALNHAHAAGVLHRDIKPENIMLTGGQVARLLDFGIARFLGPDEAESEAATATALTEAGAVVGTVGYMSPEQLRGDPLDERSDVFSLGAVLYEMLAGSPAFPGGTATERIAAILGQTPAPLTENGVPPEVAAVVARSLEREASRRPPSAASFLADLRAAASGEFVAALPDAIAVVDFENLSKNPDDDWIGSGIAESLAADLSRLPGLRVAPRGKVLALRKPTDEAARDAEAVRLGRLLACRWVLAGAYQRIGPRLRVTSRLIDVTVGETVASEKRDGSLEDIFTIQDALAASTAETLRPSGAPAPAAPKSRRVDAFESHARGRRLFLRLAKGSFDEARAAFEEAIAADPEHAPALAGLSAVHAMRFTFLTDPAELDAAAGYARRAIAADPNLGEPRVWLGYALMRQGRWEEAEQQERRAGELEPGNPYAFYFGACVFHFSGHPASARPLFQRALEIDPLHGWSWLGLGWSHYDLDAGSEAVWCFEKALELERLGGPHPTVGAAGYLGECLRRLGRLDEARRRCLEGLADVERSDNMYRDSFRAICLCALGRTALDQGDREGARASFAQALAHLHGRPRGLGGGQLVVQALAGLARATEQRELFDEARALFQARRGYDFSALWTCTDDVSRIELARTAAAIEQPGAMDLIADAKRVPTRDRP